MLPTSVASPTVHDTSFVTRQDIDPIEQAAASTDSVAAAAAAFTRTTYGRPTRRASINMTSRIQVVPPSFDPSARQRKLSGPIA